MKNSIRVDCDFSTFANKAIAEAIPENRGISLSSIIAKPDIGGNKIRISINVLKEDNFKNLRDQEMIAATPNKKI